tara:strand:+ start:7510 stop:8553 length:1044 start_codon:yes stop_codon:yes gene_type:complete
MNSGHITLLGRNRTVSASYIETMLVVAEQLGVSKDILLQQSHLSLELLQDPSNRIDERIMLSLFDLIVKQSGNDNFGLIMGQESRPGTYSALGYAVMNCANLEDAFQLIPRYEDVVMEIGQTQIKLEDKHIKLIWGTQGDAPCPRALIDSIFSSWLFLAFWLSGKKIVPHQTQLTYASPEDLSLHHQLFGENIEFSCKQNAFIFLDRSVLNEKVLQADVEMNQLMKQRAIELKAKLRSDCPTTQAITDSLRQTLPNGVSSLSFIAAKLNTSERTLRRHLKEEGNNFQELLTKLRHTLACNYLKDHNLSVLDVALLLGYSEHSSFTAAFKTWQGEAPNLYRKRILRQS